MKQAKKQTQQNSSVLNLMGKGKHLLPCKDSCRDWGFRCVVEYSPSKHMVLVLGLISEKKNCLIRTTVKINSLK